MEFLKKNLPDSKIISELYNKAKVRKDSRINFLAKLEDLSHQINNEVKYIIELFPEYTPHDGDNHLSRLFFLGDNLLGDSVIANLNCTELFILASSLYGHDWGMAVSQNEKALISQLNAPISPDQSEYALLQDEKGKFKSFLVDCYLKQGDDISQSQWQEYVRQTHAIRSGERLRKFFQNIDAGLGEAIARVSEGHWLDFKELQDSNNYPTNFTVSNETVNLRAIAIYVRLIDLLDITAERTPYVIWKYVAPKSLRSKMEWQKHRAIYSLSFPPYQDGRVVQVDGGTNDHDVYASLIDLKNFCDEQLKGCNDVLTQINDSRYNLNIFHIDWRIQARTFKPISIQFEFDRIRMFEILSDEIYQGDKYVFLRELLQNSIDAISVRRAILKKKGLKPESIGLIDIVVHNHPNGNTEIVFSDDGIGMDEYVVKNYLSVAGKSYYNSEDFKKLGLSIDPISKFGVGVLSCFMVADEIHIETFMDPYMNNGKVEAINISIPAVEKQFRINTYVNRDARIGTTFRISVLGSKLSSGFRPVDKLKVTEYLLRIAGFVTVPIKINEDGLETLIVHPNEDRSLYKLLYPTCTVKSLDMNYPWDKVFLPQSLKNSKEVLKEIKIDIVNDLKLEHIAEGVISFVQPISTDLFFFNNDQTWPGRDFIFNNKLGSYNKRIQFNSEWSSYHSFEYENIVREDDFGKSARIQEKLRIYLDGILLPNAKPPIDLFSERISTSDIDDEESEDIHRMEDRFVLPMIVLNFKKSALKSIDLSRTEIVDGSKENHWENTIKDEIKLYLGNNDLKEIEHLSMEERLSLITNLILFRKLRVSEILEIISIENWPVPVITQGGILEIKLWRDFIGKEIYLEPYKYYHFSKFLLERFEGVPANDNPLDNWNGGEFVLTNMVDHVMKRNVSAQVTLIIQLLNLIIRKTHTFSRYRFLKSPWKNGPPLLQSIWKPKDDLRLRNESKEFLFELDCVIKNFDSLNYSEFKFFWGKIISLKESEQRFKTIMLPSIGIFEKPFESKVSYGFRIINFNNTLIKNLFKLIFVIYAEKVRKTLNLAILNDIEDKISDLAYFKYTVEYRGCVLSQLNIELDSIFEMAAKELNFIENVRNRITLDSFVTNSVVKKEDNFIISFFAEDTLEFNEEDSLYSELF